MGGPDYRDNHLGPELKQFENLQFPHSNTVVRTIGPDAAYATSEYSLKARIGERQVDSGGLETLVLVKEGGAWKIRHSHTSARPRRAVSVTPVCLPLPTISLPNGSRYSQPIGDRSLPPARLSRESEN